MVQPARTPDDVRAAFFAIPEGDRNHEIIDGDLVERATPSGSHGSAQARVSAWGTNRAMHPEGRFESQTPVCTPRTKVARNEKQFECLCARQVVVAQK